MKTIEEGLALVKAQEEIADKAHEEIQRIREAMVEQFSPVKLGDIVEVNGYSHSGKKMIVDHVHLRTSVWRSTAFVAKGKILKKDGKPGSNVGEHISRIDTKGGA